MLQPVPATVEIVAKTLRDAASSVEQGDSLEGSLEWSAMGLDSEADHLGPREVEFRGSYRVGNLQGQGGVRLIGWVTPDKSPVIQVSRDFVERTLLGAEGAALTAPTDELRGLWQGVVDSAKAMLL